MDKIKILALTLAVVSTHITHGQPTNSIGTNQRYFSLITQQSSTGVAYQEEFTNGLACSVTVTRNTFENGHLYCIIYVSNETTNDFHFLNLPFEALCNIELLDFQGKPVERTILGQKVKTWWTEKRINDWIHSGVMPSSHGFWGVSPNSTMQHGSFGISELFKPKLAGEYTLYFKMRLMRNVQDVSGLHRIMMWLPQVTAKVQIRPEDIATTKIELDTPTIAPAVPSKR